MSGNTKEEMTAKTVVFDDQEICPEGYVENKVINGRPKFYYRDIGKFLHEHRGELTDKEADRLGNMYLAQVSFSYDIYTAKSIAWEFAQGDWEEHKNALREGGLTELVDADVSEEDKMVCSLIFGRACHGVADVADFNPALKKYFEIPYAKYCPDNRTAAERAADREEQA